MLDLQTIQKFYRDHQEAIDNLLSGGLPTVVLAVIGAIAGGIWWLIQQHHQRRVPHPTFPFEVIKPNGNVLQAILGGDDKDPLADRNIPYQTRVANRNICQELDEKLQESRWILILGRTGLGKTREATELAQHLNQEGWTVLYLKQGEWLDAPARLPVEIGTNRKLLFFLDDLNQKMHAGRYELSPKAEKSPLEPLRVPLQERLLQILERYEQFCGQEEIRVIATARNEKISELPSEPSQWDKLQWEKCPQLWNRFTTYELPEPEDEAILQVFADTVSKTNIQAEAAEYPELARRNDCTFSNVVVNLQQLRNDRQPLTLNNFQDTLRGTWKKRYIKAVKKYPNALYIYDAVDLLRQFDIPLYRFTVEPTARLIAVRYFWQGLWYWWQIRRALDYLIHAERIFQPRDGQIEAKDRQIAAGEYIWRLSRLVLKLADRHSQEMQSSLVYFGSIFVFAENYQKALTFFNKALKIQPDLYLAWLGKGNALVNLGDYQGAVASYDRALQVKPDYHEAWNNRGIALGNLGDYQGAVASCDRALQVKPDKHEVWDNRGYALSKLSRYAEAISNSEKALEIKPDYANAFYNKACYYALQGNVDLAVENLRQAINLNPDEYREMAKTDSDFNNIRTNVEFQNLLQRD